MKQIKSANDVHVGDNLAMFIILDRFYEKINQRNVLMVKVKCKCGTIKNIILANILTGSTVSCGCYILENRSKNVTTHGLKYHKLYRVLRLIVTRCYDKNNHSYKNYGERGIIICDEWNPKIITFGKAVENFVSWCLINGYKEGLQIDRINNNGNYEPNNCRFVTPAINARNTRKNVFYTFENQTKCVKEWSEDPRCFVTDKCIAQRLKRGMSFEDALMKPNQGGGPKPKNKTDEAQQP